MSAIAVIGGTGMDEWVGLEATRQTSASTPYGKASGALVHGRFHGTEVIFLARHGSEHKLPPHQINYRANLWALRDAGVRQVVAVAAVGGIARNFPPAALAVPDDVIDYTWGREHTYSDGGAAPLRHVEFGAPYTPAVRTALLAGARKARVRAVDGGVMGVTQGPRLESPAEIRRMRRDGCTMVGMTGMPEAALARELGLDYAALAVCVNWAAGIGRGDIHAEIEAFIAAGMMRVQSVLRFALPLLMPQRRRAR